MGGVIAALVISAMGAGNGSSTTYADTSLDTEELAFMTLLNDYRADHDLPPVLIDPSIQNAAEWMSTDMGEKNYFSHTDSLGRTPWERMCQYGYCHNTWKGENIAAGYVTGAAVFQGWKDSPGHDANMLGVNYRVMGLSRVETIGSDFRYYWTNDFGGHVAEPPPPPAPTNTPAPTASPTPRPTASPTPRPTASPTPQLTASPTAMPTASPTPTPTPEPTATPHTGAGDVNCDQVVTFEDTLKVLMFVAGVSSAATGCPPVGSLVTGKSQAQPAAGGARFRGDVDCNGVVDTEDALRILRFVSGDTSAIPGSCS
jgi:uncharacterized protein YkwD